MAALQQAMHQMYVRLTFTNEVANTLIDSHSLNNLEALRRLRETDIDSLCALVKRPGGRIVDPNNPNAMIANPGHQVSIQAVLNLKLTVYYLWYRYSTSRVTTPANIMLDNGSIRSIEQRWKSAKDYKEEALPAGKDVIDDKDWTKSIESLVDVLRGRKGTTGLPLAWCVRDNEAVAADPQDGWVTVEDEMINRAPMRVNNALTAEFKEDNQKVWDVLNSLTNGLSCRTHIDPYRTRKNGREAFFALKNHYCGEDHYNHLASTAVTNMANARYKGETSRSNFETYTRIHIESHNTLNKLKAAGAHEGIAELTKVQNFLKGIECSTLTSATGIVQGLPQYKNNFTACAAYLRSEVQRLTAKQSVRVATVHADSAGSVDGIVDADPIEAHQVVLKYYSAEDYARFTGAARAKLHQLREEQRSSGDGGKGKRRSGKSKDEKKSKKKAKVASDDDSTSATESSDDDEPEE